MEEEIAENLKQIQPLKDDYSVLQSRYQANAVTIAAKQQLHGQLADELAGNA